MNEATSGANRVILSKPSFVTRMHRNLWKRNGLSEAFCNFRRVLLYPWMLSSENACRVLYGQRAVLHLRNVQRTSDCRGTQTPLLSSSRDVQKLPRKGAVS